MDLHNSDYCGDIFWCQENSWIGQIIWKSKAEYEKARIEAKKELEQIKREDKIGREKLEEIAESLGIDYTNKDDVELRKAIDGAINKEKGS